MNRLFLANGTWQLTILAGALRTAHITPDPASMRIVLFGERLSPTLHETMEHFATTLFPQVPLLWWDKLLDLPAQPRDSFDAKRQEVFDSLGDFAPAEIWTSKIFTAPEKFVLACWPKATIQLYEEGLHSFVQKSFTPGSQLGDLLRPRVWYRGLKSAMRGSRGQWWSIMTPGVAGHQAARIEGAWFLLGKALGAPDYVPLEAVSEIDPDAMREVIASLPVPATESMSKSAGPAPFLVLGQCFSRWDRLTWDEEFAYYRDKVSLIVDRGYHIVWKDHPRADPPFGPALVEALGNTVVSVIDLPQAWPVEIVASRMALSGCATVSSSALFYLHLLYDIPTYSLADEDHLDLISYKDFAAIASFAREHIDGIDKLPGASE